jgi:probable rRNA maturation factor
MNHAPSGTFNVHLQIESSAGDIPQNSFFENCASHALSSFRQQADLTIRLVDEDESRELNRRWRGINEPTNVLSFPVEGLEHAVPGLLGDIVICIQIVHSEADIQGIPREAHWAHLIVHGILHLLGFDHAVESRAQEMEDQERVILAEMGYPDPYAA